jgi:hypothetical protein
VRARTWTCSLLVHCVSLPACCTTPYHALAADAETLGALFMDAMSAIDDFDSFCFFMQTVVDRDDPARQESKLDSSSWHK